MTNDPKTFYNAMMPEKFGADYEHTRWHKNPLQQVHFASTKRMVDRICGLLPKAPHRICELGPGPGVWTKELLTHFPDAEYALVDISKEMLDRAKEALSGRGQLTYVESNILDYTDARQFDFFFSSRVLEYIPEKGIFARKIADLLLPGGEGFVITKYPHYKRDEMLGRKASRFHMGQITPAALTGLFTQAGLTVQGVYPVTISVPLLHSPLVNKLVGKFLQRYQVNMFTGFFCESYGVHIQKPE